MQVQRGPLAALMSYGLPSEGITGKLDRISYPIRVQDL